MRGSGVNICLGLLLDISACKRDGTSDKKRLVNMGMLAISEEELIAR
jgi:hypothetical protein